MKKKRLSNLFDAKPTKYFFSQMAFGTAFSYLTSGVYLSGLAVLMGASDVLVSYISVIANICGILTLALAAFLERFRSLKRLAISLTILSKAATLLIVTIPAFLPARLQIAVFIPIVIVAFTLQAQTTVALNHWMLFFIGEEKRGQYISLRQTLSLVVTVALSMAGGYLLDAMQGRYIGFLVLFLAAFVMGAVELAILCRIPDRTLDIPPAKKLRPLDAVKLPLQAKPFLGFVIYIAVFYLLLNIADSFTMVYILRYLELPYQLATSMFMLISLPQVAMLGLWGKISDARGHHFVLKASIWFFAGETLFMAFASPQSYPFFIPAAFILASIANSGFAISVFNRRYELMPGTHRIVYDNFYTAAIGIACVLGPLLGGAAKHLLELSDAATKTMPFASIRILYLISTAGILLLQIIYAYKQRGNTRSRCTACQDACITLPGK